MDVESHVTIKREDAQSRDPLHTGSRRWASTDCKLLPLNYVMCTRTITQQLFLPTVERKT